MSRLLRISSKLLSQNGFFNNTVRSISVTSAVNLKEIQVVQEKDKLTIKAAIVESPNEPKLLEEYKKCKTEGTRFCPECSLGLEIKHTDVLILSQYLRPDGCMLPRRVTGLCRRQQKRITTMVTMAQKAGLMPNLNPSNSKNDPKKRFGFKKFNKYYDESTIKW